MTRNTKGHFNIVVAFDFSELSELAFDEALVIARHRPNAHVFTLCVGAPAGDQVRLDVGNRVAVLHEFAAIAVMKLHLAPITTRMRESEGAAVLPEVTYLVRSGDAASEIVEFAATVDADLIVLGTHGRTALQRIVLGSVAEHVVRQAGCTVLVIREKSHQRTETPPTPDAGAP